MATIKQTWRIDDDLMNDIKSFSEEQKSTTNQVVETALKQYRDRYYMKNKSTIINEEIINIIKATQDLAEQRINSKTNKHLSEIAIQTAVTNMIIARSLDISDRELYTFRLKAIDFLKENQRILRLEEIISE